MSNNYSSQGPRGRAYDHGIPEYTNGAYGMPQGRKNAPHTDLMSQNRYDMQQQTSRSIKPQHNYYVEDVEPIPLSPPRSHFARNDPYDLGHGVSPQRPLRPDQRQDYVPASQQRRHQMYQQFFEGSPTSHHGNGQWTDAGYTAAGASDRHPQPRNLQALINQMRSRAPLGPPPSARRGPSFYYQQDVPVVHSIVEETESMRSGTRHGSQPSVGSMNAARNSVPSYYLDDKSSIYSELPGTPDLAQHHELRQGRMPLPPDSPMNGSVRSASIGMKTRPTITTVKSSDRIRLESKSPSASETGTPRGREFPLSGPGEREKEPTPSETRSASEAPSMQRKQLYPSSRSGSSDALGAASIRDTSASESDEPELKKKSSKTRLGLSVGARRSKSPLVPFELRTSDVNNVDSTKSPSSDMLSPNTPSSFRAGKKRPALLNMQAVREAEKRGSLTSLPDLIKRATRLASNLDRGKTASRLGMAAWFNASADVDEKRQSVPSTMANVRQSGGSLSDMLASFPPPAISTPPQSRDEYEPKRNLTGWSSNLRHSIRLPSEDDLSREKPERKRRCCGMPLWLIILLVVIGICLIAAAIVIPVVLVVIPEQRNSQPAANTTAICQTKLPCQNGGVSILASTGDCQCLCINGFSGSTCIEQDYSGCSRVTVGTTSNVTIGSSIPRIIGDAYNNFSIPLDSSTLYGLFSSSALSCTSENALIAFSTLSRRSYQADMMIRDDASTTTAASAATTSGGIVFQDGSPSSTTTSASSMTSTSSAPKATSTSGTYTSSDTTMDFARTAVLYVFQATGQLNSAIAAQQNLQRFFSSTSGSLASAASLGLGSGASADMTQFKITLANGTTVGGGSGHG